MKRKILLTILSPICVFACTLGLVACDEGNPPAHSHSWSSAWEKDGTHHWHDCVVSDCPITDNSQKNGYAEHDFSNDDCVCGEINLAKNLKFELEPDNASYVVTGIFDNTVTELTLPDIYNNKPVTRVKYMAFSDCRRLTSVMFPDSITSIEEYAFAGCSSLTEVTFGNELESLGDYVFDGCRKLTSITIPDSLESIGEGAFNGCAIESAAIPSIACSAVNNPALQTVTITSGNAIGENAFINCSSLTDITLPDGLKSIGAEAFKNCVSLTDITIPDGVTDIGNDAFFNSSIKTASIPASAIESIPKTILNTVVITSGNAIANEAFYNCIHLTSITLPDSVTSIGENAFYNCKALKTVSYGGDITGWCAINGLDNLTKNVSALTLFIDGNELTALTVPQTVTAIPAYAFNNCVSLTDITIHDGVTDIGSNAFKGCPVENAVIPAIACRAVTNPALKTVTITSVSSIGENAFINCNSLTEVTLPDGLTDIGGNAFNGCTNLTCITLPESVTSIGKNAFYNCNSLKTVSYVGDITGWLKIIGLNNLMGLVSDATLIINGNELTALTVPQTVTAIHAYAFSNCRSLTEVTLPDGVKSIGEYAFNGCANLTRVNVPNGVTVINAYTFRNCERLRSVTISAAVRRVSESAFSGCYSLKTVSYNGDVKGWCAIDGLENLMGVVSDATLIINGNELTALSIPNDITAIPSYAFRNCGSLASVVIPDGVTSVSDSAFSGCRNLKTVSYNGDLTGWCAINGLENLMGVVSDATLIINGKELTALSIPNDIAAIPAYAFRNCGSLKSLTVNADATIIANDAFAGCHIEYAAVPASAIHHIPKTNLKTAVITSGNAISNEAFLDCANLTGVTLPDGLKSIGKDAFKNCVSLTDITIPDGVTDIGENAFTDCPVENATLPVSAVRHIPKTNLKTVVITSGNAIADEAFLDCTNLTGVTLPQGVTSIGREAFKNCTKLSDITLPDGLTCIDYGVFYNCSSLANLSVPDSVKSIGAFAFNGCSSLIDITIPNSVTSIDYAMFLGCTNLKTVTLPDGLTAIKYKTFYDCTSLTGVTLPDSVTSIGFEAFYNCTSLTGISIPQGVTNINYSTFRNCTGLISITLPDGLTSIADDAFRNCSSLISITLPDSLTNIDNAAFRNCSSLTGITIPQGVTSINSYTFYGCSNLSTVTLPDGLTSICTNAFYNCTSLTDITLPQGVTSIGDHAFYYCNGLTTVTLPDSITSIEEFSFAHCPALTDIRYDGTKQQWNAIAKHTDWFADSKNFTIHCTDGNITAVNS